MTIKPLTVFTSATGRRYVDVADLAFICGLPALELDTRYRPMAWATPRDFRWDGRRMWFAVLSLPQLVQELFAQNQSDAALKLQEWSAAWISAAVAERNSFDAGHGFGAPVTEAAVQTAPRVAAVASTPAGEAARVEPWMQRWEQKQP